MFQSLRQRINRFVGRTEEVAEKEVRLTKATRIKGVLRKTIKLSVKDFENILYDLQLDLIQNDVAVETTEAILNELRSRLVDREIVKEDLDRFIRDSLMETLLDVFTPEEVDFLSLIRGSEKPFKMVFFGVNGSGKTTTIAKVARYLMDNNLSVVFAAGDTFRAGAIEQIERHSESLGVKLIKHQKGADAAAVIYDAVEHARVKKVDVVLADTAGRMQTNVNLMNEMKKICRVNNPDLRVFVGDSLTGNDAVDQAERFGEMVGIDAIILTKMDADARGGSAISISHVTKKPIIFVGMGQGYRDLKRFDREWFVEQLLG
ncbi:MAG: signal recognition particle-docking protein FtsY [Candidatus Altiarchaeota archaeon]|nr:signal recognition particle-docking protein FtsY [Candidatus Altiarchaeota archaeon]